MNAERPFPSELWQHIPAAVQDYIHALEARVTALEGEDSQPERHQVTEIPPIKPVVTEYHLHQLCCPACGEATRGELPVGVASGAFGPRVQAITALCTGA